jgi:hypothetical protein
VDEFGSKGGYEAEVYLTATTLFQPDKGAWVEGRAKHSCSLSQFIRL